MLAAWAIIVWIVVVYLGEHYVADVVGGIAYSAAAIAIVNLAAGLTSRQVQVDAPAR